MKIVHVVSTLDPAVGGPPQVAVRLAAAQAALGHEIHLVYYAASSHQERVAQQLERVPHRARLHLHPLPDPGRYERLFATRAQRALRDVIVGADFVHIHGVWDAILKKAADVARSQCVPYCFRPAGMLDPWSLAQKPWKKRLALALGYRAALEASSFIHSLNVDEKRLIEPLRLGVPIVVLGNGVFVEEIEPLPRRGTFRAAHPELGTDPFILFLARLHYKKGLDVLAEAFQALAKVHDRVRLVVAGPDGGAREDFVRRVATAGLDDRVHVVGPLYGRDKFAALADAACFCLPSRQEGFSVAITEAMACGIPVVISEACHFPEVAEAQAGIVVALDATALATALGAIVADPAEASRKGAAGAALVRARYTWAIIAAQSIGRYQTARPSPPC